MQIYGVWGESMRIAEYKQIDERIEVIHHEATYDEEGNILAEAYDEEKHIPIMSMVYRDMTPEEIAELPQEDPLEEPTQEDKIEAQVLYTALMTDTLLEEI